MASALYPSFKQLLLGGDIALDADTIKASLIDTGTYTFSTAHDNFDDLTGVVASSAALSSKSITSGTFDAADVTISAVTGNSVEAIVVWKDTGTTTTSSLIAFIDGISVTPNGGSITISWNASGIFDL